MSFINVVYDVKIYMLVMSHNGMASIKLSTLVKPVMIPPFQIIFPLQDCVGILHVSAR